MLFFPHPGGDRKKIVLSDPGFDSTYYKLLFTMIPCMGFLFLRSPRNGARVHVSVYALESGFTPKELLAVLEGGYSFEVSEETRALHTYRDTFDWRISRAGLSLSTSKVGRRNRVSLAAPDGEILEVALSRIPAFASDLPAGRVSELLHPVTAHRRLFPKARAEWKGTLIAVLSEDGKTVVRLLLREGKALAIGDSSTIPLSPRLEFLSLKGYRSEEKEVRSFLRRTLKLKKDRRTEIETVYDAVGQTPDDYSSTFHLSLEPAAPAALAARQIHQALFQVMLVNREGVTRDWDSEFLHDFRVAVRRTRSALTQLKGIFPQGDVDHFSEEFRWLGKKTGDARDYDVYLLNIPAYRESLHPEAQKDLEPLVRLLQEKKSVEHRKLRRCMGSRRFQLLVKDWQTYLNGPDILDPGLFDAQRPIGEVASERIWKAFTKVLKRGAKIGETTPAKALHRLRIDCKKLRYLITFFRSLYPAEALDPIIRELKRLQDHLGDFNDLQVQQEALQRFAEELMAIEIGPPATLLAMGQLMGQQEGKQILEREAFHHYFQEFSRPKNQKRFRDLFGPEPGEGSQPQTVEEAP